MGTEEDTGRGWVVLVVHSFQGKEISELLTKNIARTARRQLDRQRLLYGE